MSFAEKNDAFNASSTRGGFSGEPLRRECSLAQAGVAGAISEEYYHSGALRQLTGGHREDYLRVASVERGYTLDGETPSLLAEQTWMSGDSVKLMLSTADANSMLVGLRTGSIPERGYSEKVQWLKDPNLEPAEFDKLVALAGNHSLAQHLPVTGCEVAVRQERLKDAPYSVAPVMRGGDVLRDGEGRGFIAVSRAEAIDALSFGAGLPKERLSQTGELLFANPKLIDLKDNDVNGGLKDVLEKISASGRTVQSTVLVDPFAVFGCVDGQSNPIAYKNMFFEAARESVTESALRTISLTQANEKILTLEVVQNRERALERQHDRGRGVSR